jgi:Zn-dependent peptidase ImmA (M78 family)
VLDSEVGMFAVLLLMPRTMTWPMVAHSRMSGDELAKHFRVTSTVLAKRLELLKGGCSL